MDKETELKQKIYEILLEISQDNKEGLLWRTDEIYIICKRHFEED